MSTPIIKSASLNGSRLRLGAVQNAPVDHAGADSSLADDIERRLREELSRQFNAQLDEAREAAKQDGYQQGYKEGLTAGHAEGVQAGKEMLSKQLAVLETALGRADESMAAFWRETEGAANDIAFEAVCQLMGEHALDASVVAGMIRQVMKRLHEGDVTRVRLHPAECAAIQRALDAGDHALRLQLGRLAERLEEDDRLESGGCVIDTPRGDYCASLDVQLTRLRRALQTHRSLDRASDLSSGVACA